MPAPKPLLDYDLIHTFPTSRGVLPLEGFQFAGADYCGEQPSAWESSEISWDNGDPEYGTGRQTAPDRGYGRWHGPGALHLRPAALWIEGAQSERVGHDDLARVTEEQAAAGPGLIWTMENPGFIAAKGGEQRIIAQSAPTGAVLLSTLLPLHARAVVLPSLSTPAVVWARVETSSREWALPPDYLEMRGFAEVPARFQYSEGGAEYVWDWEADVGRRPAAKNQLSQTGEVMWEEYSALLLNGGLLHRGQWSQYISDGSTPTTGGPWSALRIAVGNSDFAVGEEFQPAPGAVLHRLDDAAGKTPVLVDPLALSVSAFAVLRDGADAGQARLGGTIATRSGPHTAYWHFHPGQAADATLLATSERNYVPVCEASLYPTVSDLLEVSPRGDNALSEEMVLSFSHLYRYAPDEPDLTKRLPGVPLETNGHPGGRCLRLVDAVRRWFTEYFGKVGAALSNDRFAQFYGTLKSLSSRGSSSGRGTVFHGDCCAEVFDGRFYGWAQDKDFGDETAQQFLAFLQNETWVADEFEGFSASTHRWQRLRALSTPGGQRLLACGKDATSENAIWAVVDKQELREAALNFRARRLTRISMPDGGERIYTVGRFVEAGENDVPQVSLSWSVIALSGEFVKVCMFWDEAREAFTVPRESATARGLDPDKLPAFLKWKARPDQPAGGYWIREETQPEGVPFLALMDDGETIAYAPVPDASALPYGPAHWDHFCFTVYDDGGVNGDFWPPKPRCTDAACVGVQKYIVASTETGGNVWEAIQVSDVSDVDAVTGLRKLHALGASVPNLWLRIDSDAAKDDLSSYTVPIKWNESVSLPRPARERVDVCVLVPEGAGRVFTLVIDKGN